MLEMPFEVAVEFCGMDVWANPEVCPSCGTRINQKSARFSCKDAPVQSGFDLSMSSEAFFIATKRFVEACKDFTGVSFIPLENGYFVLEFERCVDLALPDDPMLQSDLCVTCELYRKQLPGRYYSTTLSPSEPPISELEMVRSKLGLGDYLLKIPSLIVGDCVRVGIENAKLEGIRFDEVVVEGKQV